MSKNKTPLTAEQKDLFATQRKLLEKNILIYYFKKYFKERILIKIQIKILIKILIIKK